MPRLTASARVWAPSFASTDATWYLAVWLEMASSRDGLVPQALRHEAEHVHLPRREPRRRRHGIGELGQLAARAFPDHELGPLGLGHQQNVGIRPEQRGHTVSELRASDREMDPERHGRTPCQSPSTSRAGTASASPPTIIAETPITRPSASAMGPPEFPGASRTAACTHA